MSALVLHSASCHSAGSNPASRFFMHSAGVAQPAEAAASRNIKLRLSLQAYMEPVAGSRFANSPADAGSNPALRVRWAVAIIRRSSNGRTCGLSLNRELNGENRQQDKRPGSCHVYNMAPACPGRLRSDRLFLSHRHITGSCDNPREVGAVHG